MKLLEYKRWIFGALIVAAIAVLVWVVGPMVSIGTSRPLDSALTRTIVIVLALLIWLGLEGLRMWRIRRRSRQLIDGLTENSAGDAAESQTEARQLNDRFTAAMSTLKNGRFGNISGTAALYSLPWYMFVGAPGSGKTTALQNCGLRFPLSKPGESAEVGGQGGTRNCDWLFSDQAVLIDTAGRYLTQDSNRPVDLAAWKTFLGLLKRFRPRQPINGIIVTLSVHDLLSFDFRKRQIYGQVVRDRIEELQRELGLDFPVYVLVTKVDLVSGFNEFFSTFDAEQRAQVWGVTFDLDLKTRIAENAKAGFDKGFAVLLAKVNELLFQRLQDERDAERRAVMYPFPQQLASLGPLISEFLGEAFGDAKQAGQVLVRGVYFTSGTQQGAPIDRLLGSLSRSLNLVGRSARTAPQVGAAKAFFITRLLRDVVFQEAALAGFSERRESTLRRISWGLMAAGALLTVGFVAAEAVSYFHNRDALQAALSVSAHARAQLAAVDPSQGDDLPQLVEALGSLKQVPASIHDPVDEPPLKMRWGLYQGTAVDEQVETRYRSALKQGLLPRVAIQLEKTMLDPAAKTEEVYAALKGYVMLFEPLHLDPDWFGELVTTDWARLYKDPAFSAAAKPHLTELVRLPDLQVGAYHSRNESAVSFARERVAKLQLAERAYTILRGTPTGQGDTLRPSEWVGPDGVDLERASGKKLTEPIPAIFSREGYRVAVRGQVKAIVDSVAIEEEWVMGEHSSGIGKSRVADVVDAVQHRYFDDFKATWTELLKDVRPRAPRDLRDAMAIANLLARPNSPLRDLVWHVDQETRLSAPESKEQLIAGAVKDRVKEQIKVRLASRTGSKVADAAFSGPAVAAKEASLDKEFEGLRRLVGDGKSGEVDQAAQVFTDLASELAKLQRAGSSTGLHVVPPELTALRARAERFAAPYSGAILVLIDYAEREAVGGVTKELKASLGGAAALCVRSIAGRYPFTRTSAQDLGVKDFASIFKKDGELDAFFNTNLAAFVVKSGAWHLKASGEGTPPVSPAALRQFQNADAIRRAYFADDGSSPSVKATIHLVKGDDEAALEYDGSSQKLHDGAKVNWPVRSSVARLVIGKQVVAAAEGPWALFRLIDRGQVEAGSAGDKISVAYAAPGGAKVILDVRAESSDANPFRLREMTSFACPSQ